MERDRSRRIDDEQLRRYLRHHRQRTLTYLTIYALIILSLAPSSCPQPDMTVPR